MVCPMGTAACGGTCRNLQTDDAHCGACGNSCGPGTRCIAGVCTVPCPSGQTACEGTCTTLATDRAHCGQCGNACGTTQVCIAGSCVTGFQGAGATWIANGRAYGRFTWAQGGTTNNGRANAAAACARMGGSLARPNSVEEWTAIRDNLVANTEGWWIDGHNNFVCGNATASSPKTYEYGLMYPPTGQSSMYTGCNCNTGEQGLVVYRYGSSSNFDGCTPNNTPSGSLGVMDEQLTYSHQGIVGFLCMR